MNRWEKIARIRMGRWFAWGDVIVLAAAVLLMAAWSLCALSIHQDGRAFFCVYFPSGKKVSAGMEEDAEYLFYIDGDEGIVIPYTGAVDRSDYNLIRVQGGSVCVLSADCPDKTCIFLGEHTWGEILCMAHEMMIRVEGGGLETDI